MGNHFSASFTRATSGFQAIEILKAKAEQFQMVISDFNMANGTGKDVFDFLKKHHPEIPFILVTSESWFDHGEFHGYPKVGYVAKPFMDDVLIAEVERLMKVCNLEGHFAQQYVAISLQTLLNIKQISYPLYIKINEEKYLKFIHPGTELTVDSVQKYHQKGIEYLFVERLYFPAFTASFRHRVMTDMIFREGATTSNEVLELSTAVQEIVVGAVRMFGLSGETQEVARKNIQMVRYLSEKYPEINGIFKWAIVSQQEYAFAHSILICYLAADVVIGLNGQGSHASEILSLAGFFHDIALEVHQIRNEQRFIKALALNSTINREDLQAVREHPMTSADMIKAWAFCPKEVFTIIHEHHERPDGTGFPERKKWNELNELSAIFIVCEDLVQSYLEHRDRAAVEKYFASQNKTYSHGTFQAVHEYLLNKLRAY